MLTLAFRALFFAGLSASAFFALFAGAFFLGAALALPLPLPFPAFMKSRSPDASEAVCPPESDESESVGEPESESEAWKSSSRGRMGVSTARVK